MGRLGYVLQRSGDPESPAGERFFGIRLRLRGRIELDAGQQIPRIGHLGVDCFEPLTQFQLASLQEGQQLRYRDHVERKLLAGPDALDTTEIVAIGRPHREEQSLPRLQRERSLTIRRVCFATIESAQTRLLLVAIGLLRQQPFA